MNLVIIFNIKKRNFSLLSYKKTLPIKIDFYFSKKKLRVLFIMDECESLFVPEPYYLFKNLGNGYYGPTVILRKQECRTVYVGKYFNRNLIGTNEEQLRFIQHIETQKHINTEYIANYLEHYETPTYIIGIRKFVEGIPMTSYLDSKIHDSLNYRVAQWRVIVRMYHLLSLNGVSPTFIKPSNIIFQSQKYIYITDLHYPPDRFDPKIHDLSSSSICFLAPECFDSSVKNGDHSNIWSLGIMMLYMITSDVPYNMQNVVMALKQIKRGEVTIPPGLPRNIAELLGYILIPDINDRITYTDLLRINFKHSQEEEYNYKSSDVSPHVFRIVASREDSDTGRTTRILNGFRFGTPHIKKNGLIKNIRATRSQLPPLR